MSLFSGPLPTCLARWSLVGYRVCLCWMSSVGFLTIWIGVMVGLILWWCDLLGQWFEHCCIAALWSITSSCVLQSFGHSHVTHFVQHWWCSVLVTSHAWLLTSMGILPGILPRPGDYPSLVVVQLWQSLTIRVVDIFLHNPKQYLMKLSHLISHYGIMTSHIHLIVQALFFFLFLISQCISIFVIDAHLSRFLSFWFYIF